MESLQQELKALIDLYNQDGVRTTLDDSIDHKELKKAVEDSTASDRNASSTQVDGNPQPASEGTKSRTSGGVSTSAISFSSKVSPNDKHAFAAELLEIITVATSFF